ncbi:radical SAM protein [Azospirillum sp. 11R-A]|uniref:radical SAM/SPASM domain-containing protein n=1 Tax=Azospirillum sp. 11R-A TaxID=3111634 RepID=UPI003C2A9951
MAARSRYEADKIAAIKSFANFCRGTELPRFPLELFFEVSNVCNLKCAMCAEFSAINPYRLQIIKGKDRGLIKPDEFDNNFLSLLKSALFVHCSGFGESTIHPQFREIIKLVSSYDVMIHFITNGQELNSDLAEFLVEQGVHKIMVSCSGTTKEDYEKVYIGGNYDTLVDGLKRLKEAKQAKGTRYPLVEINSLGFHHHVANFDKFVDLMADCGADIIHLKKLQPYDRIPELYEHVSYMRPWVEGVVIQRALEIGARRGVVVGVNQYLHNAVETEEEYQELIKHLETEVDGKLSFAKFGENTIDTFAQISRAPKAEGSAAKKLRPIIHAEDSLDQASQMLNIAELKEAGTGNDKFYCMEPFKTAYVSNNGGLRPCCFSGSDHPFLGSVKIEDGIQSWRGAGFQALQKGVLEGKYPTNMCTRCLKDKIGPTDHFAFNIVQDYLDWYVDRFRSDLSGTLEEEAPDVIRLMQQSPSKSIIKRFKGEEAPPRVAQDAKMQLEIILAAGTQIPIVEANVKGLLEGWFERVSGSKVEGWVWSPAFPDVRIPIRVWHDGVLIAEGIANRSRGDLERAGKGDGCHGFIINLPWREGGWRKEQVSITIGNEPNCMTLRG